MVAQPARDPPLHPARPEGAEEVEAAPDDVTELQPAAAERSQLEELELIVVVVVGEEERAADAGVATRLPAQAVEGHQRRLHPGRGRELPPAERVAGAERSVEERPELAARARLARELVREDTMVLLPLVRAERELQREREVAPPLLLERGRALEPRTPGRRKLVLARARRALHEVPLLARAERDPGEDLLGAHAAREHTVLAGEAARERLEADPLHRTDQREPDLLGSGIGERVDVLEQERRRCARLRRERHDREGDQGPSAHVRILRQGRGRGKHVQAS